jgi:lipopolysaccharide heptosyltransferase I
LDREGAISAARSRPLRVAIVRLTSLGDVVHTLPLAHALRRHRPTPYIIWIVEEREQALLLDNPAVDELVVGPTRRWRRGLRTPRGAIRVLTEWKTLWDRLRSLRIDVVIDVQGLMKSAHFTMLTRAPIRIGFGWRHARDPLASFFATHRVTPPSEAVHIVDKNLSLLAPLGIARHDVGFPIPVVPDAEARAVAFLEAYGVTPHDRVVALLPATRQAVKQWPPESYRALALRLMKHGGIRLLLLGGPGERALLQAISRGIEDQVLQSVDGSIADLVALLRRTHLAVGNDTGPLHLAAALDVPAIGLYGPTRADRNGPYGPRATSIQSSTSRMADIPVETVARLATERLR